MDNNEKQFLFKGNRRNSLHETINDKRTRMRYMRIDISKKENEVSERLKLFNDHEIVYCGR